ncbi:hypothetical protein FGADI_11220 [Fusarium gaditjirri]|uniref:Uncharacterized protein n=1 Tax=Fusarium gaditjirri TaxID=282569 RepID=A0A8H4SVE7_9HYPO|nr:hypothetical protein FGADI_11220 [Fusarium gaditjirri]
MSSQDKNNVSNKETNGSRRRSSASLATMGNFGNEPVDRSSETVMTRKQKRANRRSTLRLQSEVAPFLGMELDDEDEAKEVNQAEEMKDGKDEDEAEKEK